jgi:hypothetical protein
VLGSLTISGISISAIKAEMIKQLIAKTATLYELRLTKISLTCYSAWMTMIEGLAANRTLEEFTLQTERLPPKQEISSARVGQIIQQAKYLCILGYDRHIKDVELFLAPFSNSLRLHRLLAQIPSSLEWALSDTYGRDRIGNTAYIDDWHTIYPFNRDTHFELGKFIRWDIWRVLKCCRAIAGSRFKLVDSSTQLDFQGFPVEIYIVICENLVLEADHLSGEVLSLVVRCALDRNTVGKIRRKEIESSSMKLAYICRCLLAGL